MQGLGGRLSHKPAHAEEILGMGNHYLIDKRWKADKLCAYWETALHDWWYEEEYIVFIQKLNVLKHQAIKAQEFSEETREESVALYLPWLTTEKAIQLRKAWKDLRLILEQRKTDCVRHKCGAFVLPDNISSSEDVCFNCDCKYQPFLANPIFQPAFQKLAPELVPLLF